MYCIPIIPITRAFARADDLNCIICCWTHLVLEVSEKRKIRLVLLQLRLGWSAQSKHRQAGAQWTHRAGFPACFRWPATSPSWPVGWTSPLGTATTPPSFGSTQVSGRKHVLSMYSTPTWVICLPTSFYTRIYTMHKCTVQKILNTYVHVNLL